MDLEGAFNLFFIFMIVFFYNNVYFLIILFQGKQFLVLENISQFYRMLIPIPVWYRYFMLPYTTASVDYLALISTIGYFLLKVDKHTTSTIG